MSVCVFFGSSKITEDDIVYKDTMQLADFVASMGYDIATGAYGGVMEAALKGALNHNVKRFGVTCNLFNKRLPNDFLSDEIKTKDYFERLEILIDIGDIFIAMTGESGTLLEVSAVTALIERNFIEDRFLILVGQDWKNLDCFLNFPDKKEFLDVAEDIDSAISIIKKLK